MERVLPRIAAIRQGNPLSLETQIGAQVSRAQIEKIENYVSIGLKEGAELLIGGGRPPLNGELAGAITTSRPCSRATTRCACSRRRSSARCWR